MNISIVTLNRMIFQRYASLTEITVSVKASMLAVIIQRHNDLKSRTRGILSHGSPVQQAAVRFVAYKPVPVFRKRIGIEIRLAYHCKNFSGGRLQGHYSPFSVSQSVVGNCLQIRS